MSKIQSDVYNAAIPANSLTFYGLAYFVKAEDSAGHTTYSDTLSHEIYFPDEYFTTSEIKSAFQTGFPRGEWHMVSAPAVLDKPGISDVLFDETELKSYGIPNWKLFSYEDSNNDGITDSNVEYSSNLESSIFRFKTGKAFWLKANPEGEKIEIDVSAGQILALEPIAITLKPGWNQIGNPFAFPILFSTSNSMIVDKLYLPDGNGGYQLTDIMQPWAGYFIFVDGSQSTNLTFNPILSTPLGKPVVEDGEWILQLSASSGQYRDDINYIGINEKSLNGCDNKDYPEPPTMGEYVSLRFLHAEWDKLCKYFTSDIRYSIEQGQIWKFEIVSNLKNSMMVLNWSNLETSLPGLKFTLYDLDRNKIIDMNFVFVLLIIIKTSKEIITRYSL